VTLLPGTYCGGLQVTSVSNVYFTPGIYYIANGDFYIASSATSVPDCSTARRRDHRPDPDDGNNADIGGFYGPSDNNVTLKRRPSPAPTRASCLPGSPRQRRHDDVDLEDLHGQLAQQRDPVGRDLLSQQPDRHLEHQQFRRQPPTAARSGSGRYIKFSSFNNNYKGGCATFGTTPVGVNTTTTVTKGKVFE
jgi:hypothetical protein